MVCVHPIVCALEWVAPAAPLDCSGLVLVLRDVLLYVLFLGASFGFLVLFTSRRHRYCVVISPLITIWGRAVYLYRLGGHMWHTVVRRVCFPASRARCGHWSSSLFASGGVVTVVQACFASSGRARCRCLGRCSWVHWCAVVVCGNSVGFV